MVYQEQVHAARRRPGRLLARRGRHAAQGHGQEGPRPHGRAAREVHRRAARPTRSSAKEGRARSGSSSRSSRATGSTSRHAACYGVVAYQTAYLKANYPVEFMAALLTSEMDEHGQDRPVHGRVPRHGPARWCRPTSTSPAPQFARRPATPSGSGSAAIKNVGREGDRVDRARARERTARSRSLDDFCARLDLRLVNRRVVESLIKAGAFDSLKAHAGPAPGRARPGASRRASAASATARKGQVSLFDALAGPAAGPAASRDLPTPSVARVADRAAPGSTRRRCSAFTSPATRSSGIGTSRAAPRPSSAPRSSRQVEVGARVLLCGPCRRSARSRRRAATAWRFATLEDGRRHARGHDLPRALRQSLRTPALRSPPAGRAGQGSTRRQGPRSCSPRSPAAPRAEAERAADGATAVPRPAGSGGAARRVVPIALPALRAICEAHRGTVPLAAPPPRWRRPRARRAAPVPCACVRLGGVRRVPLATRAPGEGRAPRHRRGPDGQSLGRGDVDLEMRTRSISSSRILELEKRASPPSARAGAPRAPTRRCGGSRSGSSGSSARSTGS